MKRSYALVVLGLLAIAGHACAEVVSESTSVRKLSGYGGSVASASATAYSGGYGGVAAANANSYASGGGYARSNAVAISGGGFGHPHGGKNVVPVVYQQPRPRFYNRCYWNKHGHGCPRYNHPVVYNKGYHHGRKMLGGGSYAQASAVAIAGPSYGKGYPQPFYQPHHGKGKGGHYGKVHYQPRRWYRRNHFNKYIPQWFSKGH